MTRMTVAAALLCMLGAAGAAFAAGPTPSPYAGEQHREIKALSPKDVQDLLAGRGMGLAKSAELNRYPGPAHVLELLDRLGPSAEQEARTQSVFDAMEARARALGKALVEREAELLAHEQIAKYVELRGYNTADHSGGDAGSHRH